MAAELLKIEGFRYFQQTGAYRGKTHADAFPDFADAVEAMIEHEIKDYIVAVQPPPGGGPGSGSGSRSPIQK